MIVFCEDCGGKNILPSKPLKNEKIIFKCLFCAYSNNYTLKALDKLQIHKKVLSFKQLSASTDILGGFLYHREKGVLVNHMPEVLTLDDINFLGLNLFKNIDLCQKLNIDIEQMVLYISERHTAVRQIDPEIIIVVIAVTQKALYQISDFLNDLVKEPFEFDG